MSHRDDETMSEIMNGFMSKFDNTALKAEWTHDGHVAEDSVFAWLDGALDATESDAVQAHVSTCAACSESVAEARGYIAASTRIMHAADVTQRLAVSRDDAKRSADQNIPRAVVASKASQNRAAQGAWSSSTRVGPWYARTGLLATAALLTLAVGTYAMLRDRSDGESTKPEQPTPAVAQIRHDQPTADSPDTDAYRQRRADSSAVVAAASKSGMRDLANSSEAAVVPSAATRVAVRDSTHVPNRSSIATVAAADSTALSPLSTSLAVTTATVEPESLTIRIKPPVSSELSMLSGRVAGVPIRGGKPVATRQVHGVVIDARSGEPVGAAVVSVAGTDRSVITNDSGQFVLDELPNDKNALVVRRIGYESSQLKIAAATGTNEDAPVQITLKAAVLSLSTIVTSVASKPVRSCSEFETTVSGVHAPLVGRIRIRYTDDVPDQAVIYGWPNKNSELRMSLTAAAEQLLLGSITRQGVKLTIALQQRDDEVVGIIREFRGANARSENIRYALKSDDRCR